MSNVNPEAFESRNQQPDGAESSFRNSVNVIDLLKGFSQLNSSDSKNGTVQGYDMPGLSLTTPTSEGTWVGDKGGKRSKPESEDKSDIAEKSKERVGANGDKSAEQKFTTATTAEREHLLNSIEKSKDIPEKEKKAMIKDMADFENRASRDHLSRQEVLGVYNAASKLLDASRNDHVTRHDRVVLAEQIVKLAAHPMSVDQGEHSTCNVATVEARVYFKYPSKAAELVSDVALTGEFKTSSNHRIKIDNASLVPDSEAKNNPVIVDGERCYASQIFQITAVNIHWQEQTRDLNGNRKHVGDLRYVQETPADRDVGERVKDFSSNPKGVTISGPEGLVVTPRLDGDQQHMISNEITGKGEKGFVLSSNAGFDVVTIGNKEQLAKTLANMGDKAPLIIKVHTKNEPFYTDSEEGKAGGSGGWHVVNILKYDAATGTATMSNQWGSKTDHTISLDQLYKAMYKPLEARK